MTSNRENEEKFDELTDRFDALISGEQKATENATDDHAESEYGRSIGDNERQRAAIDCFDDDGQPDKELAEDVIDRVEDSGTYTDEEIDDVKERVSAWETHLRGRWGDEKVDRWLNDSN